MQSFKTHTALWLVLLLFVAGPAYGQMHGAVESAASDYWSLSYLFKTIVALLVVIGFFILSARIMQRFQIKGSNSHGELEIVAGLSLGSKEKIMVIRAGNEQLVVGVTPNQINTLLVLDTPLKANDNSADVFRNKLASVVANRKKETS